jgi:hypothetical protein
MPSSVKQQMEETLLWFKANRPYRPPTAGVLAAAMGALPVGRLTVAVVVWVTLRSMEATVQSLMAALDLEPTIS